VVEILEAEMTTNWLTTKYREASKVDPIKRYWVNDGLRQGINVTRVADLLGLSHADVTAIWYADGYWKERDE
jgi:hypothetical protein